MDRPLAPFPAALYIHRMDRNAELEAFKCQINLSEFAASLGYRLNRKASCRTSVEMVSLDGDKVVIMRGTDHH